MTTVFLNVLLLSKTKTKEGEWITANCPRLLMINGTLLWASFIVFRLILFPAWLVWFGSDWFDLSKDIQSRISVIELVIYPSVTVLLLWLSLTWFGRINAGFIKALGITTNAKKHSD